MNYRSVALATILLFLALTSAAQNTGQLQVNLTDVLGHDLPGRIELQGAGLDKPFVLEVPKGNLVAEAPVGKFTAYVYVYLMGVPVMVDAKEVTITTGNPGFVLLNLLEGTGTKPLLAFDKDFDFVLDRVEMACGTDPADASSIPGRPKLIVNDKMDEKVIEKKAGWYRGELHAHSSYGGGKESVAELIQRAEREKLDFLAIADRNTMDACKDPSFKSNTVALIPAMEWGNDETGVALIYGAKTLPQFVPSIPQAQALVDLVQAQGGFFAIAHPCFPTSPWQWGLGYVNGIEVWCRDWASVPPLAPEQLNEDMCQRVKGKFIYSIAFAAAMKGMSANGQACAFYDSEVVRGLKAAVFAGSNSSSKEVPMGRPVTYVYALEKSPRGILDGLRRGRTFITTGVDGPKISFDADVLDDGKVDVSVGGIVPLGVPTRFAAAVEGAKGKELQILCNGRPVVSKIVEGDSFALHFKETPDNYSVYRVRLIAPASKDSFALAEVLAMSSPIYAQELKMPDKQIEEYKKQHRRVREDAPEINLPKSEGNQIIPKWKF